MTEFGLWALPPHMIAEVIQRNSLQSLVPEALRALMGGQEAKAPADPIRDGATVVLPVAGVLSPKGSYGGTGTARLGDRIREFGADGKIGTVVLDISSPGGLVYGTQEAADAIFEVRQVKPIVAVANPLAASAAFWLASQASAFYASTSADVGSIGVYGSHTDQSALRDKIGLHTTLIASKDSPKKVDGNPFQALSEQALADAQAEVDESMATFVAAVARGRGVTPDAVRANYGQGGMLSASRAAAAGVVDGVMTLRDVVAKYGASRARLTLMRRRAEAHRVLHSI